MGIIATLSFYLMLRGWIIVTQNVDDRVGCRKIGSHRDIWACAGYRLDSAGVGQVIKTWTIGETSVEDLDVKPDCDFYIDGDLKGAVKIGGAFVREALKSFGRL
jgi:hypothetical protein